MTDLRDTISDHLGGFESLMKRIPGYKGYKEREIRREADVLLRDHLALRLSEHLTRAEDVTSQMLTGPGLAHLDDMGKANTRLQTLIDKVKTAAQGYAGFFDSIKVREEELDSLYAFDEGMMSHIDQISQAVDALQAALDSGDADQLPPVIRRYTKVVTDTSALFDRRRDTMLGLS